MRFEAQARFMYNFRPIKFCSMSSACTNVVTQIICFNVVLSMRLQPHITHIHQRHHVHIKVDCPVHACNHTTDTKETMYNTCPGTNFDINHTSKLRPNLSPGGVCGVYWTLTQRVYVNFAPIRQQTPQVPWTARAWRRFRSTLLQACMRL